MTRDIEGWANGLVAFSDLAVARSQANGLRAGGGDASGGMLRDMCGAYDRLKCGLSHVAGPTPVRRVGRAFPVGVGDGGR
jgi:hypothetical protein